MRCKKIKWSIESVDEFVKSNSSSILLSSTYISTKKKLLFLCNCGNKFLTTFEKFKDRNKRKCNKCSYAIEAIRNSFSYEEIKQYIKTNSDCELLSKEYIRGDAPLSLRCHCGRIFKTTFYYFKKNNSKCCNYCGNLFSRGEKVVEEYLKSINLRYESQFKFDELRADNGKHRLRFDFAVFNNDNSIRFLIEYDGKQHFQAVEYFGGHKSLLQTRRNDRKKENFCKSKNIPLVRIPYSYNNEQVEEYINNIVSQTIA